MPHLWESDSREEPVIALSGRAISFHLEQSDEPLNLYEGQNELSGAGDVVDGGAQDPPYRSQDTRFPHMYSSRRLPRAWGK